MEIHREVLLDCALADRDRGYLEIAASLFVEFHSARANFHPAKLARLTAMIVTSRREPGVGRGAARTRRLRPNCLIYDLCWR